MNMTTIYLTDEQIDFFNRHKEISRSEVIRQSLDAYIRKYKGVKK